MVTTMNVFSWMDPPSAGLEVTIKPPNEAAQTLRMGADTAPQVFAAAATYLLANHWLQRGRTFNQNALSWTYK
jgi:hypothetical protein